MSKRSSSWWGTGHVCPGSSCDAVYHWGKGRGPGEGDNSSKTLDPDVCLGLWSVAPMYVGTTASAQAPFSEPYVAVSAQAHQ